MPRYVAFLRAVNVGGRFVKMDVMRNALSDNGFTDVETHIQSGNVLVASPMRSPARVAGRVAEVLGECAGFEVPAVIRTPDQVRGLIAAVDGIPALQGGDPKRYVAFANGTIPAEAAAVLDAWDSPGERARVIGADVLAEFAVPFHQIRLTNARIERITGLTTTWRDLTVVRAVAEKWGSS